MFTLKKTIIDNLAKKSLIVEFQLFENLKNTQYIYRILRLLNTY